MLGIKGVIILLTNLYTVIKSTPNQIVIKLGNKEHPVFKAHFPNQPILPGFLQIDIISNILNDKIIKIIYSKFLAPIYPNDEIIVDINTFNKEKTITIEKNKKKITKMKYEFLEIK